MVTEKKKSGKYDVIMQQRALEVFTHGNILIAMHLAGSIDLTVAHRGQDVALEWNGIERASELDD